MLLTPPPPTPPPVVRGVDVAPPPAWAEAGGRAIWTKHGSYCWRTACVDMIPPSVRTSPKLTAARGDRVRIHLRFQPLNGIQVRVGNRAAVAVTNVRSGVVTWRARRAGLVVVFARAEQGDATYVFALRIRP